MSESFDTLAELLEYPNHDWQWSSTLTSEAQFDLKSFIDSVQALSISELQELYTRTFDLNPVCALEIGYHLFGENYKRGEFLANLRETEAPFDLGQQQQLPDYLPVLLRLLAKLNDKELHDSLIGECLIPGIDKMLAAFKDTENPYRLLLKAIRAELQRIVPIVATPTAELNLRASLPVIQSLGG
jgi:nitrate reductase delta subunit